MTSPQRCFHLLAALCLASCTSLPTAPEPAEFKLSSDELRQQSKATRSLGIVDLYADSINSSQDEKGETFHLATGNVLLVKKSTPPIHAKAPEILLNSEHAEVRGLSVVKKGDLLHFGEAAESKILIDGVQVLPKGPHNLKRLSSGPPKPISKPSKEIKAEPLPAPEVPAAKVKSAPEVNPEPKSESRPTPKPVAKPQAPKTTPKSKPKATPKPTPAKPVAKPTTPAPKPAAPAVDRAKLLQLMREPE